MEASFVVSSQRRLSTMKRLKGQSNDWRHPSSWRRHIVCSALCQRKVMFIVAHDIDGVVLHHSIPLGHTSTASCC
ncbi:hypothetical protein TNCT_616571 [Trichonephila clavata]|uniref:Uncharacterized protein n=1 Tax=Trichonephila clavata TaxID=2740835 RepID=A0A8X6GC19_TRICU|nr:hypothetical protein TNCT_616571 [Trichonephila clavata]